MGALTIMGGNGFIGKEFIKNVPESIGRAYNINARDDYRVYSGDVLYLISTTHNYHILDNPFLDIDTNLTTLIKVLENWRAYQTETGDRGTFYFASSWFVYGPLATGKSAYERDRCRPSGGFYSVTKYAAEQMLRSYCIAHDLRWKTMRFGNVLGASDKDVSQHKSVLQYFIKEMKANRKIKLADGGMFYRDFIDVRDVCRAIQLVMEKHFTPDTINIGNGTALCVFDLLLYAADQLKLPTPKLDSNTWEPVYLWFETVRSSCDSIGYMCLNNEILRSIGYKQKYTIWHTLDDLIEQL